MLHVSLLLPALFAAVGPPAVADPTRPARRIDYTRDVRPILSSNCFRCHGPDNGSRKAGLRLDTFAGATKKLRTGSLAIAPGHLAKSELIDRINSDDMTSVMPPPKAGKRLTAEEVATLKAWVSQGAKYGDHWAYIKPIRPAIPGVRDVTWARNPLDRFIQARLEQEHLVPTPAAEPVALLRRLALDLTGLPPTIEEADRFLADRSPNAYEKLVDRLLASPAYGERWAGPWLDMARYADSQGYANDPDRTIWRWRDWAIEAFNANLPYDQFTIEQLAGDLLPQPTTEQLIATGFHRNTLTNTEGGTNAEEFRSAAIVDRVNTTMQVWMGTTIGCAQCHNHKYDPFSQKEYFQLYAILNNTQDRNSGDDFPTLRIPRAGSEARIAAIEARLPGLRKDRDALTRKLDANIAKWEKTADRRSLAKDVVVILNVPAAKRNGKQKQRLLSYHRSLSSSWQLLDGQVRLLESQLPTLSTTTPILREGTPRVTHIQIRGNFLDLGERVNAGLPAALAIPTESFRPFRKRAGKGPLNRLTLAKWIVSPDNPLTARVAVNRLWEELFGTGLVQTSEEFGAQGELPSHPELLDFLATEYMRSGWDTKRMLRLIVTSATYRQGSQVSGELNKRDPFNRLLARGSRLRLSAETIRDQALFVGGLLSQKMYGQPVQPMRPNYGLSAAFGSSTDWQPSQGQDRHRRGLYTRWRRNAPYPSATTFDAPERTVCNVRRIRTNTPLQALVTLNDPVYVEAAQGLSRRIMAQTGSTKQRVEFAFRACLTRSPRDIETTRLVSLYEKIHKQLSSNPTKAQALAANPIGPVPTGMSAVDLAAWTVVGNVLLNLDETLARR